MSDFARLEDKLAKLRERERPSGEARRLRGGDAEALIGALVTEIDETILPRRLTFRIEGRGEIHLAVANRRLQAVLAPLPETAGTYDLAGRALADEEDPGIAELHRILAALFQGAGVIEVVAGRQSGGGFASDVGVPARILARVWNVEDRQAPEADPRAAIAGFVAGIGDEALAWLVIEGEDVTDQGGDAERLTRLGDEAAVFLDCYFAKFDSLFDEAADPCCTVIAPAAPDATAVLFVEYGDSSLFVAAPSARVARLASRWQALVAK